jgi:hypothetical protein
MQALTWFAFGIVPAGIFAVFLAAVWSRSRGSKRAYAVLGLCAWMACGLVAAFSPNRVTANYYLIASALIFLFLAWPIKKT